MFMLPDFENRAVTFRTPIIHFGTSTNHIEFGDIPKWLFKFENLLSKLYWSRAEAHFVTDISGSHRFAWEADDAIFESYHVGNPQPTTRWKRHLFAGEKAIEL
jgi:hypothetical protein